jgi:hypothetical protein
MGVLKYKFINDNFKRLRGGYSRLLDISCTKCGRHVCYYQKDGSGILKRMYIDRMLDFNQSDGKQLICPECMEHLGNNIIYEKENRPAYRLFVGSVTKKIVKSH